MTSQMLGILYKRNTNGSVQQWQMEVKENRFRTHFGQVGGKITTSAWTVCEGKNICRSNQTRPDQQARLEAEAKYKRKVESGYHANINNIHEPGFFKPMLAHKYKSYPTDSQYVFSQPKLDGIRMIANKNRLYTRTGKPVLSVPHIKEKLELHFQLNSNIVLDGELYSHDMKDNFEGLVSIARKTKLTTEDIQKSCTFLEYHIYDIYIESKPDLCYSNRLDILENIIIDNGTSCVKLVPTAVVKTQEELDEWYNKYMLKGYEGQMVRLNDYPYENKRSKSLLKRKEFDDAEFEIVEIVEGKGQWSGYAKSVELRLPNGNTFNSGIRGNQQYCRDLLKDKNDYVGKQATVRYQGTSQYGVPRFPVVQIFHKEERM